LDNSRPRARFLLQKLIFGRRLANREFRRRKIGAVEGVPAMGLDALASAAYGPEAALAILIPIGTFGPRILSWILLPILALLAALYLSYRQTIRAYPSNGGAYVVARENLGTGASLVAATALMIDYVLNIAVGISAGVAALTSALPALHSHTLSLCLAVLGLVAIANLRGTQDAGRVFAVPTYLFAASLAAILTIGLAKAIAATGHPQPVVAPPLPPRATAALGGWLILRAFAAGCTAMTGVEAVSNGVGAFREPVVRRAHNTLSAIVALLGMLLAGIAYLASAYGIGAMDQTLPGYQSVLSQLVGAVIGRGPFYYVAIGSVLCVLCLSANTSFVDFPRMCRLVAEDGFLPQPFAVVGRRLVFSVGIAYLAGAAGLLLIVFGGITDRLIPLFAVGAFLTFTISQAGMVVHWRRELEHCAAARQRRGLRVRLAINAGGAATTGIALAVIIVAKFTAGAWITILVIPCVIALLLTIKRYYAMLEAQLRDEGPIDLGNPGPLFVLVAMEAWNRLTDRALQLALRISPDVAAVHLTALGGPDDRERRGALRRQWAKDVETPAKEAGLRPPQLLLLEAPYRRIEAPLLELVAGIEKDHPGRQVAVLIPELVKQHWWQYLLHRRRARRLRSALLRYGGSRLAVIELPWYREEPRIEEGLEEEEKAGKARPAAARQVGERERAGQ
jgi:amino acid transporter